MEKTISTNNLIWSTDIKKKYKLYDIEKYSKKHPMAGVYYDKIYNRYWFTTDDGKKNIIRYPNMKTNKMQEKQHVMIIKSIS